MDRFDRHILETIRERCLIPPGSSLILGLSGGADSVCLLSCLQDLKDLLKLQLKAVHVNHSLRGEEAERDQGFCEELCREKGIPFEAVRVDVAALVREKGLSTEEAARVLRYEALRERAGKDGLIAVAHHADDQAETILFHLIRGTGLKGMRGMEYRSGNVIRPLLDVTREEILRTVAERRLPYVTDSTNESPDYARNRIRHVILPELSGLNRAAARHLLEAGEKAGAAEEFLEDCAARKAEELAVKGEKTGEVRVLRKKLAAEPQILRRYVIIRLLSEAGVPQKDWGEVHIARIDRLLGEAKGLRLDLPGGVTAENSASETIIRKA